MQHYVTPEKCIYTDAEDFVAEFNHYVEKNLSLLPIYTEFNHSTPDMLASIFNYWLQMIDDPKLRVPKPDRMIFHHLSIVYHQYAAKHYKTQLLKSKYPNNNEVLMIFAYFVYHKIQIYLNEELPGELLKQYQLMANTLSYYEQTDVDAEKNYHIELFKKRKQLSYNLQQDQTTKFRLSQIIDNSLQQTSKFYAKKAQVQN